MAIAFQPTLHRVFDEILKYEGCPRLDQAAAFCNLADFDRCKAKAFRESRDGRTASSWSLETNTTLRPTSSGNGLARTLTGS
jgi:hypothetical protein